MLSVSHGTKDGSRIFFSFEGGRLPGTTSCILLDEENRETVSRMNQKSFSPTISMQQFR
jgi:hypothetical protein